MANEPEAARLMTLLAPLHDASRATARRLCRSHADGDDLFQETVLRALDQLSGLRDVTRFRAWFYAVMISVHRARHRRHFWRRLLSFDELGKERGAGGPDSKIEGYEGAQRMARALATLTPEAREAIVLFELEGFTLEELAALQRDSIPAVKSRLSRARERLRRHYQKLEGVRPLLAKERRHGSG